MPSCLSARSWLGAALMGALPLFAGCASTQVEGRTDALAWARYVAGEDLRAGCTEGAPGRLRLILRQADDRILSYDISETPDGATIRASEIGSDDDGRLRIEKFGANAVRPGEVQLSPQLYAELMARLVAGGVFGGRPGFPGDPRDRRLWLVAGCYDGQHFLGLWANPAPDGGRTGIP